MVRQKTDLRIHEEISVLQKKLSETDIQLSEEKKTQVRLTNEANAKVKELNAVLQAIEDEEASFTSDTKAMTHDTKMIERKNKDRMKELKDKKTSLEHYISAMDTIEGENEYLRAQIISLTRDYDETIVAQEEEREKIKQRNFDSRMTMESVLRKEIQTLDTNFKVLAIQSMNDEAMTASSENQGLYAELSRREDLSRSMICEQQSSYEELQRISIEHEVMITAADYYENIINELGRVVKKQESKERRMKLEKEQFEDTVQTYDSICNEKFDQAKNVLDLYKEFELIKGKNKKIQAGCIKQCQRALKLAIERAGEQQSSGSQQLSQDARMIEEAKQREREAAEEELLSINAMLSRSKSQLSVPCNSDNSNSVSDSFSGSLKKTAAPPSEQGEGEEEENYEAMWQSSSVKFPQLTGAIRTAVLRDDRHKHAYSFDDKRSRKNRSKKKLLLPKGVSASMTNHI